MQLVVLGSGTSVFHARRAAPAFWLETESGSILLDCSSDAPHRMAQENLDWMNLDAIWISHLHLDHCGGLAPFLFGIKNAPRIEQRTKPLRIFGCEGIKKLLQAIDESHNYKLFQQRFAIETQEIMPRDAANFFEIIMGVKAETISTPHRRESLAISLTDTNGATVVYSSDTGYSEDVALFSRGADLLILECSFYRDKSIATHLELADAMRMAQIAEPRTLVLTHLYPEWDAVDLEGEAMKLWSGETIAARDGLRLEIGQNHLR
jgi:ribonuclease BN (tRNA processing enzyme)